MGKSANLVLEQKRWMQRRAQPESVRAMGLGKDKGKEMGCRKP